MLFRYYLTEQRDSAPPTWPVDIFVKLSVPYESIIPTLEIIFINNESPFTGRNRRVVAQNILYVVRRWLEDTSAGGGLLLGGEDNLVAVAGTLRAILSSGSLDEKESEEARILTTKIDQALR